MEENRTLFRTEAVNHRLNRNLGVMRINVPFNYQITGIFALILLAVIVGFLCFAQTTERTYVRGYLDSDAGIITVSAEIGGIIHKADVV